MSRIKPNATFLALPKTEQWFYSAYMDFREKAYAYSDNPKQVWELDDPSTKFWNVFGMILIISLSAFAIFGAIGLAFWLVPTFTSIVLGIVAFAGTGAWLLTKHLGS